MRAGWWAVVWINYYYYIEKSVQNVNDDKYPLTFPRFVDASIDPPPPQAKNPV